MQINGSCITFDGSDGVLLGKAINRAISIAREQGLVSDGDVPGGMAVSAVCGVGSLVLNNLSFDYQSLRFSGLGWKSRFVASRLNGAVDERYNQIIEHEVVRHCMWWAKHRRKDLHADLMNALMRHGGSGDSSSDSGSVTSSDSTSSSGSD